MKFYTKKNKDTYIGYCKEYPGLSYEERTQEDAFEGIVHLSIVVIEDMIKDWTLDLNDRLQGLSILLTKNSDDGIFLGKLSKQLEDCYGQLSEEVE